MHPFVQHCSIFLERTPPLLNSWLSGLDESLLQQNDGEGTWSPFDVIGHLLYGEKTDWIPRLKIILNEGEERPFDAFDRFAQEEFSEGRSFDQLLAEFTDWRKRNLRELEEIDPWKAELSKTGIHPDFGRVTARQLLATWMVHDQTHIYQIARTIVFPFREEVGPWSAFLRILNQNYRK